MKNLFALTMMIALLSVPIFSAANPGNGKLLISLENIDEQSGTLHVVLFTQPVGFPYNTENSFMELTIDLADENAAKEFTSIPLGTYAYMVYLDGNGNGKLDRNFVGKPKEAYGFSNNAALWNSTFDACAFEFTETNQTATLLLNTSTPKEVAPNNVVSGSVAK